MFQTFFTGLDEAIEMVKCKFCGKHTSADEAHLHDKEYVCEECWDDRLKITE